MSLLEDLNWRHACKAYDPTKKIQKEDLEQILEAARLAPSSSGLQPFKLIVVEDQNLKDQIAPSAFNPECARECSHILVFAAWDRYTEERIDTMYNFTTDERDLPRGRFESYTDMLKKMYLQEAAESNFAHIARQTYIALGLALAQAAELKIDSTPAEGFDNAAVDQVLGLEAMGLKSVSLMYIGYADKERDWLAPMKKVRWPREEFILEM
ncbi:NAD(P)H-dependent oxidoreductase [Sphingobacterium sp. lm-10]|uniref:NAD(P)H-dependent oxidoreductase n=1 Tax=Sphingobacterium sp. lm-10 TaxID=2944904 RepID=UPI002021FE6C|nr:NAD(P)H-dependent oxidoreductase [Sphingobacterium sp. lm-10]MCL7988245.1 NAD(P)H-dependent oxidoreductase [Sphingobacterium sp. lm-10]